MLDTKAENVKVTSCTIEDLFDINKKPLPETDIKGEIVIPEYQRPYKWIARKHVYQLLNDIDRELAKNNLENNEYRFVQ